jgi:hypothetical protein
MLSSWAPWIQEIIVLAIVATAAIALLRTLAGGRARACPACAPRRSLPRSGVRPRGLTILP